MARAGTVHQSKPRKVQLSCDCVLWLKKPYPHIGELLWCSKHQSFEEVGPGEARTAQTEYPDFEWTSKPHPVTGWVGTCWNCPHSYHTKLSWYDLRDHMESHHMREHTGSTKLPQAQEVPIPSRLPPNSPPPF